jgi:hypothetical protein
MVDTKATADVANNDIEESRCVNDGDGDRSSNHAATEQPVSGHNLGSSAPGQYFSLALMDRPGLW